MALENNPPPDLTIYLREVQRQCQFVLNAATALDHALKDYDQAQQEFFGSIKTGTPEDPNVTRRFTLICEPEVFRQVHAVVTHAANVSKLLWPGNVQEKETDSAAEKARKVFRKSRGDNLCRMLGIPVNDHILKSKAVRNRLEHFDEDLDDCLGKGSPVLIQDILGPIQNLSSLGWREKDVMRWFDPISRDFISRGEKSNLRQVVLAIQEMHGTVTKLIGQ